MTKQERIDELEQELELAHKLIEQYKQQESDFIEQMDLIVQEYYKNH